MLNASIAKLQTNNDDELFSWKLAKSKMDMNQLVIQSQWNQTTVESHI